MHLASTLTSALLWFHALVRQSVHFDPAMRVVWSPRSGSDGCLLSARTAPTLAGRGGGGFGTCRLLSCASTDARRWRWLWRRGKSRYASSLAWERIVNS